MLRFHSVVFGCDPELFFRKGKEIVGADKVLPRSGLAVKDYTGDFAYDSRIIIDGVQAELNPAPNTCRQSLAYAIADSFVALKEYLKDFKGVSVDFTQTIELSDSDFEKLSDDSKKFGCMPSKNAYRNGRNSKIRVRPDVYRYRSAGGHIHLGWNSEPIRKVMENPVRLVKMLDILVGNTCVLIDRDPGNIERRKVYGKAGEFRTPKHGVEYRTLSNFWLRNQALMSLVFGLARQAVIIVANDRDGDFLKLVNMKDIAKAINNNDFSLALRNFKKIEKLLLEITPENDSYPIDRSTIAEFRHFVKKGLDYWFNEDPMEHWVRNAEVLDDGFADFLDVRVRDDLNK